MYIRCYRLMCRVGVALRFHTPVLPPRCTQVGIVKSIEQYDVAAISDLLDLQYKAQVLVTHEYKLKVHEILLEAYF